MLRALLPLVAVLTAGLGAAQPAAAGAAVDPGVAAVQITMRSRALYHGPVTGWADEPTRRSIRLLQQRLGVTADGIFGAQTREHLFPLGPPVLGARLLSIGSKGYDVALLRVQLAFHGFPSGRFTSAFTPRTARAVLRFQRFAGLPTTGLAGPLTARALRRRPTVAPRALAWPVPTWVTSGYGLRGARFHGGVDLAARLGRPVAAPQAGRVVYAGWRNGGWGNAVMIAHDGGMRSLVAHLARIDVKIGARVRLGQQVGLAGSTGDSSAPHVHFEVRVRGAYVDPMTALDR